MTPGIIESAGCEIISHEFSARSDDAQQTNGSLDAVLQSTERREIVNALQRSGGQRASAARLLQISRSRLYRRMGALGIDTGSNGHAL